MRQDRSTMTASYEAAVIRAWVTGWSDARLARAIAQRRRADHTERLATGVLRALMQERNAAAASGPAAEGPGTGQGMTAARPTRAAGKTTRRRPGPA